MIDAAHAWMRKMNTVTTTERYLFKLVFTTCKINNRAAHADEMWRRKIGETCCLEDVLTGCEYRAGLTYALAVALMGVPASATPTGGTFQSIDCTIIYFH